MVFSVLCLWAVAAAVAVPATSATGLIWPVIARLVIFWELLTILGEPGVICLGILLPAFLVSIGAALTRLRHCCKEGIFIAIVCIMNGLLFTHAVAKWRDVLIDVLEESVLDSARIAGVRPVLNYAFGTVAVQLAAATSDSTMFALDDLEA